MPINVGKIIGIGPWLLMKLRSALSMLWSYSVFIVLLFLYLVKALTEKLVWLRVLRWIPKGCDVLMAKLDKVASGEVSRAYMIELALKNLRAKKIRAMITIGGVALGVGAIVFLVSLGYGLEKMVISKVARLDELKMLDVGLGEVSSLKMNDEFVKKINEVKEVDQVIPVVGMVSKVKFRNSVTDVMAFGVDQRYIKAVGVKVISGTDFKDKEVGYRFVGGVVAGTSQEIIKVNKGQKIGEGVVRFNVDGSSKSDVYAECNSESDNLGYLIRIEGGMVGERVWG